MKLAKLSVILFVTVLLISLFAVQAQAAESCITTDVLADILGAFNAMYETQIGDNTSLYVTGIYGSILGLADVFGAAGGVNYYFDGKVLEGTYVGGGLCYVGASAGSTSVGGVSVDARFGYKMAMSDSAIFDISYGLFDALNLSFGVRL
ncbi:MAG TPA: hypothetical protein VHY08_23980 [Bacillota bacterium]|nr:hypothetical protein [Bacillota bacterium]